MINNGHFMWDGSAKGAASYSFAAATERETIKSTRESSGISFSGNGEYSNIALSLSYEKTTESSKAYRTKTRTAIAKRSAYAVMGQLTMSSEEISQVR